MSYDGWLNGVPPTHWRRVLSFDVGGASANAMEWGALCPETQTLVMYDEIHLVTTDMRLLAQEALPKMKDHEGIDYDFIFKVVDYENRVAADEIGRNGLPFTNAIKTNKNLSIQRFSSYLHPNPRRPFPSWHPRAGQLGAPLCFITPVCKNLIKEIPTQKWKSGEGDQVKDEMDRSVKHDTVDCCLYIARLLPAPAEIPIPKVARPDETQMSLQSRLYWEDVKRFRERQVEGEQRRPYHPAHGGQDWKQVLGSY
jgi:hypothetical protein